MGKCRERCWKKDWVIDLDVQKFFDSVRWDLIVKAVEVHTDAPWVVLYVNRWLRAPIQQSDGTLLERTRGTPQGSSVSPRAGQSVPALRVRRLAGPGIPGGRVRTLRR
ncbi:reverse transcriptase domain-containing protein [Nocardia sp. NPDC050193]